MRSCSSFLRLSASSFVIPTLATASRTTGFFAASSRNASSKLCGPSEASNVCTEDVQYREESKKRSGLHVHKHDGQLSTSHSAFRISHSTCNYLSAAGTGGATGKPHAVVHRRDNETVKVVVAHDHVVVVFQLQARA